MRLTPRFLLSAAAPLAALPGRAVAEGMPQLHFKDPLLQGQVVWGAIIFIVFYLLLSRSALPKVADVIKAREVRVRNDLDVARRARKDADQAQKELCEAREKAMEEARATIQGIRDTAKEKIRVQAEETAARLEAEIKKAEAQIALSRSNALGSINEIASSTATVLTERLVGTADQRAIAAAVEHAHAARS
ncbi:hypothetical protein DTJ15_07265 [Parasaccharibacter sp. TMW 2.1891]|uniref:F0F1 ATP synthase subunit B family protein n=1 Tax=Parasaccharibacter sp. TMW 2.1891 TaxID=2267836 RepID=UPI0020134304|nr:hypothetical protein [Parasaccharibacter sp. TMW 2.1891]MCL1513999.1 hypothetical protein [Parasaccharibacter sp. TMW 2.1891]MCQ0041750.1 hypothetical protein [Bombella sp.]